MPRGIILPSLLISVTLAAAAPPKMSNEDTLRLLERVAGRYLQMTEYDAEVTITSQASLPGLELRTYYRLAASAPARFHLSRHDDNRQLSQTIVSDGRVVWAAQAQAKRYSSTPVRDEKGSIVRSQGVSAFADRHIRYKERFDLLAKREQKPPKFEKYEEIEIAGAKTRCAVVRTESRETAPKLHWAETLWIDPDRLLVLRSRRQFLPEAGAFPPVTNLPEFSPSEMPSVEDVRFYWRKTEGPIDDALFRFEPPPGFLKE